TDSSGGLASLMMGIVGALLVGVGLIVLIGHNWDHFSRPMRLACAFGPLLLAQLWTGSLLRRGATEAAWKLESAALLQTLTTGACLALVSQIYHIGGTWTEFLLSWCLLTLPLVWAVRVRFVAVFYLLGIGAWSLGQMDSLAVWYLSPWMHPLLLLGLWPYCPGFRLENAPDLLLRWALTLCAISGITACSSYSTMSNGMAADHSGDASNWLPLLGIAGLCLFPLTKTGVAESLKAKPQVFLSALVLLSYAYVSTFIQNSAHFSAAAWTGVSLTWGRLLLLVFLAFATMAIRQGRFAVLSLGMIPLVPLLANVLPVSLSILFTVYLAAVGLTLIVLDFYGRPAAPRSGATILTILIFVRMADSQFSLLTKGLVFTGVGIAFLAFNQFMSVRKRNAGGIAV
ncbi:MAG: DUF2157 domain-containing protein, partial [Verrucomicrobiota bacterium]